MTKSWGIMEIFHMFVLLSQEIGTRNIIFIMQPVIMDI